MDKKELEKQVADLLASVAPDAWLVERVANFVETYARQHTTSTNVFQSLIDEFHADYRKFEVEDQENEEADYIKGKAVGKSLAYADVVYRMRNTISNAGAVNSMIMANAAQILAGFVWKNELPKKVFTGSLDRGFQVDQTVLLEYLMKFQQWVHDGQPKLKEVINEPSPQSQQTDLGERSKPVCLHDGKINSGHHADQPSWCDQCGEDL